MVCAGKSESSQAAKHICENVPRIELAVVRKEALRNLASDSEDERTDDQGNMDYSSSVCVKDEIERCSQGEEAYEMQYFVRLGWDVWLCRGRG